MDSTLVADAICFDGRSAREVQQRTAIPKCGRLHHNRIGRAQLASSRTGRVTLSFSRSKRRRVTVAASPAEAIRRLSDGRRGASFSAEASGRVIRARVEVGNWPGARDRGPPQF
ncbi:MAG: hypothetical protein JWL62_3731 [Hyphomicrobiales bacterium]|nr:hypothetical protein [Hyphomicrobiales bacterium]